MYILMLINFYQFLFNINLMVFLNGRKGQEMKEQDTISIIGTCICRDIFGLQNMDGGYKIERFIQDISPMVIGANRGFPYCSRELFETISENCGMTSFGKRNFILDFCGQALQYLGQVHSNYLLLDMGCCRFDCYKVSNNRLLTKMHNDQKVQLDYINQILNTYNEDRSIDSVSDNDILIKMMDKYLPYYFEKIKSMYSLERIILLETKVTEYSLTLQEGLSSNPYANLLKNWNIRINYANALAKKILVGCHFIKFPSGVLSDPNHKWGQSALHYRKEYYDYAFSCVNIIAKKYEKKVEEQLLAEELHKAEALNNTILFQGIGTTIKRLNESNNLNQRLIKYSDYFRELLMNPAKLENTIIFLKSNNYKTIGIYGLSQVGIYWIDFLEKNGFEIKFIVENGGTSLYQNRIMKLKRDITVYPKVDLIIVADFNQYKYLKELLPKYTNAHIIDVFELIN